MGLCGIREATLPTVVHAVRHHPQKIRRLVPRKHCRQVIQKLARKALQFEQVDEVLFVHAGSVMVDSGAVTSHFCRDRQETARKEGSPLTPMSLHCLGYRGQTSDRHADRAWT